MTKPVANPGTIIWSGENPGLTLKLEAEGPATVRISHFRTVFSPYGEGHALFIVTDPERSRLGEDAVTAVLTDNPPMAELLGDRLVQHFGGFPVQDGRLAMPVAPARFHFHGDSRRYRAEIVHTADHTIELYWEDLVAPFLVELDSMALGSAVYDLRSLFIPATTARVVVNGIPAAGHAFPEPFYDHPSSSAFLAFSESWAELR